MANYMTTNTVIGGIISPIIIIALLSLVKEPYRQKINALIIASAGAVYWSAGFGPLEFAFLPPMIFTGYKGLTDYKYIGIGWLLHTCWDIAHHLYGNPIVPFDGTTSAGCAICDPILAIWFFAGAPNIFKILIGKTRKAY